MVGCELMRLKVSKPMSWGVKYKVSLANGHLSISIEDPLNRGGNSSRLLGYLANAIERALNGKMPKAYGRLVGLMQLPGGLTARLYEKKTMTS